ncbi:hypothetical protein EMGBD1_16770 [Anaerolineaceae bacterium]|nr:hypothetical protein EMGBD1_16770 [Anaerolineaceae bacterium]
MAIGLERSAGMSFRLPIERAFEQAPWRRDVQLLTALTILSISLLLLGGVYVREASHAVVAGRDVQRLRREIIELRFENDRVQAGLSLARSAPLVRQRAITELGFAPMLFKRTFFLEVPVSFEAQPVVALAEPEILPAQYARETISAWLQRKFTGTGLSPGE